MKSTRVSDNTATLIDHIWTTQIETNANKIIIHTDTLDHFQISSQFYPKAQKMAHVLVEKRLIIQTALKNLKSIHHT